MDEEHKGLFCGIFDMAAFPNDQSKVDVLVKRVVDHFTNEEVDINVYNIHIILYMDYKSSIYFIIIHNL